jgi:hypothetical protein
MSGPDFGCSEGLQYERGGGRELTSMNRLSTPPPDTAGWSQAGGAKTPLVDAATFLLGDERRKLAQVPLPSPVRYVPN